MKFEQPSCLCGSTQSWHVSWSDSRQEVHKLAELYQINNLPNRGWLELRMCSKCGLGFTSPYPDQELLDVYYSGLYRTEEGRLTASALFENELKYGNEILEWMNGTVKGNVLDIGCGSGGILHVMQDKANKCIGYDMDDQYLEVGRKYGLDLRNGRLCDIPLEEKFDTIILRHVLEHLYNPLEALLKLRGLLSDSGVLYIEVPNNKVEIGLPRHHILLCHKWHFYPRVLEAVVMAAGLNILKMYAGTIDKTGVIKILAERNGRFSSPVDIGQALRLSKLRMTMMRIKCIYYRAKTRARRLAEWLEKLDNKETVI